MAQFYYKLVKAGKLDIADVPAKWQEQVKKLLADN